MGEEGAVGRADSLRNSRAVRVNVLPQGSSAPEVVLVRNSQEVRRVRWDPGQPEVVFQDEASLEEIAVTDARFHPDPFVVYYVRVENQFGETQWSSPIWLDLVG